MAHHAHHPAAALSHGLARLDHRLGIEHRGTSEWIWAGPALTFVGAFALILIAGTMGGASVAAVAPVAVVVALVITGMCVTHLSSETDMSSGDDRPRRR